MQIPDPVSPSVSSRSMAAVQLSQQNGRFLVLADGGRPSFMLPPLPKSRVDWLAMAAADFLERHQRCVAFVLVMNLQSREWTCDVPHQRCSRDSACWSLTLRNSPPEGSADCIAGSFQARILSPGEAPRDAVPPIEGVHLVLIFGTPTPLIWTFVRFGGQLLQVPAHALIEDDLGEFVQLCEVRAQLV